jgi:hypothetical protein
MAGSGKDPTGSLMAERGELDVAVGINTRPPMGQPVPLSFECHQYGQARWAELG